MLNELYTIYRGLEALGKEPKIKHNDIQEPGVNNVTFRVLLDKDGQVSKVALMTKEQIQDCWSVGNKQNQFPAVKVKRPLLPGGHNDYLLWKNEHKRPSESQYRELINGLFSLYFRPLDHFDIWPDYRHVILEKKKILQHHNNECFEVYELFRRYSQTRTGVEILEQVAKYIGTNLLTADLLTLKASCSLLFGEKLKPKGEIEDAKRITLILDCRARQDLDTFSTSRKYVPGLSRALFAEEAKKTKKSNNGICALSKKDGQLVGNTFPEEKLAVIGPTIIFSKNDGTSGKTVERYGQSRGKAFPVSKDLSQKLAAGISFVTSEKYKDITWSKLPSSSLLLAYCRANYDLPITPLITGKSEIEEFDDYIDATESVLASFQGTDLNLDSAVDFVEIIKVDKANRKINFSTTARIGQLIQAVKNWKEACGNSPDFRLFAQVKKNKNLMCSPWAISPRQMITLSQKKYIRDGSQFTPVPGVSFADALKLFLGKNRSDWIRKFLHNFSDQYQPLLRYCALSKLQSSLPKKSITVKTSPKHNAQALSAVTLISVLLYKSGRTKELYMNDFSFQLGQLCSAMDEVHIGYCMSERGGSIPNTLLGNQVYGMALQDPVKAMAFMATRRRPYDSWAKRKKIQLNSKDDKDKQKSKTIQNAVYAQRWMGKQAAKLNQYLRESDISTSDSYKAELMLGYLAGRPFVKKKESTKPNTDKGENNESTI